MTITVLTNQSTSAPALTGAAGSLLAVLDYCLVTALGWSKTSTGNVAAYRQPSGSNQIYLRVDDSGTTSARVRAYEAITSLSGDTGTNPTPSDAQVSGGLFWSKSSVASSTQRPWTFISDGKLFYLIMGGSSTTPATWSSTGSGTYVYAFGDFTSTKPSDAYGTTIIGDTAVNSTSQIASITNTSSVTATLTGHYTLRVHSQTGTSIANGKHADNMAMAASSTIGSGPLAYPATISGGIEMSRVLIGEAAGRRGRMPGLWCSHHPVTAFSVLDTFSGAAGTELAAKSFLIHKGNGPALFVFETSDTWSS